MVAASVCSQIPRIFLLPSKFLYFATEFDRCGFFICQFWSATWRVIFHPFSVESIASYHWPCFFDILCFFRFGRVISSERIVNIWAINIFKHHVVMDQWMSKRAFHFTIHIRFFLALNDDARLLFIYYIIKLLFSSCCSFFRSCVAGITAYGGWITSSHIEYEKNSDMMKTRRPTEKNLMRSAALTIGDLKFIEGPNEKFQ